MSLNRVYCLLPRETLAFSRVSAPDEKGAAGRRDRMSEVRIKDNESLDSALKRFKRNCAKAGVLSDLRKKEFYQSPSVKRRKKSEAARKKKNKKF